MFVRRSPVGESPSAESGGTSGSSTSLKVQLQPHPTIEQQVDVGPELLNERQRPRAGLTDPLVQPGDVLVHRGDGCARVPRSVPDDRGEAAAQGEPMWRGLPDGSPLHDWISGLGQGSSGEARVCEPKPVASEQPGEMPRDRPLLPEARVGATPVVCITASGRPALVLAAVLEFLLAVPPGR